MNERDHSEGTDARPSDLEGGGTEQTWGQGSGAHDPTIGEEADTAPEPTTSYADGTATELDDAPLNREDEGMDR
jgi:hypothetical protein